MDKNTIIACMKAVCPFCQKGLPLVAYDDGTQSNKMMHVEANEKWDTYFFCKAIPLHEMLEACPSKEVTFDAFVEEKEETKKYVFTYTQSELKKWLETLFKSGKA